MEEVIRMGQKYFIREWIETAGRRWWFLLLVLLPQCIPPYASQGYRLREWGAVNAYIVTHSIKSSFAGLFPVFQIATLIFFTAVFCVGKRAARLFGAYAALSYTLMALLQNISVGDSYGLAVCAANGITFLTLAGLWLWEAVAPKNRFEMQKKAVWEYWPLLLALVSFWEPLNPDTLGPDFNPVYLLTSGASLSFCMATPLYLAVLVLYFPGVNRIVLAVSGLVGLVMGLGNMVLEFVITPAYWWIGVLHFPLLILSIYSLVLVLNETLRETGNPAAFNE